MTSIVCRIVEVCVFKTRDGETHFLLLRRAADEKVYPGIWQFISGGIEESEKAFDAALRELGEETRLQPTAFWNVPFTNSFYDHRRDTMNVSPFFVAEVTAESEPTISAEHHEYAWFGFEEANRKLVWPGQREGLKMVRNYILSGEEAGKLTRLF